MIRSRGECRRADGGGAPAPCCRRRHEPVVSLAVSNAACRRRRNGVHRRRPRRGAAPARHRGRRRRRLDARARAGEGRRSPPPSTRASRRCSPTTRSTSSTSRRRTTCTTRRCKAALAAGKHVVCEKPLALTVDAVRASSFELAERERLVHCTNFNIRFYPQCRRRARCVADGALGRVCDVHGGYLQDWLLQRHRLELAARARRGRRAARGRRHRLALARPRRSSSPARGSRRSSPTSRRASPCGAPARARSRPSPAAADVERVDAPMSTEDLAHILLRFEGGARGSLVALAGQRGAQELRCASRSTARAVRSPGTPERTGGALARPSRPAERAAAGDPALLSPGRCAQTTRAATPRASPTRSSELYRAVYGAVEAGGMPDEPDFPTFRDGHRANVLGDASRCRTASGGGWRWTAEARAVDGAFAELPLEGVAEWAAGEGFGMLEIACWPASGAERRRYSGVSHIDVTSFDPARCTRRSTATGSGSPRSRTTRTTCTRTTPSRAGQRAPAQGDRRGAAPGRVHRGHVRRQRQGPAPAENLARFREIWPPSWTTRASAASSSRSRTAR